MEKGIKQRSGMRIGGKREWGEGVTKNENPDRDKGELGGAPRMHKRSLINSDPALFLMRNQR